MYDIVATKIQKLVGLTKSFPIKVGPTSRFDSKPIHFYGHYEKISKSIWETVPWCILFADNIVLVAETKEKVNDKLEEWRVALECKGLRISRINW